MKKNIQEYLTYVTPKFVFVPFDDMTKLRIKRNKIVFNNMFLGVFNNNDNIYSPVSGNIIGIKEMNTNTASYIDKVLSVDEEFFSAIGKEVLLSSVPRANVKFDLENRKTESANVFALLGVKGVTDAFYYEKD